MSFFSLRSALDKMGIQRFGLTSKSVYFKNVKNKRMEKMKNPPLPRTPHINQTLIPPSTVNSKKTYVAPEGTIMGPSSTRSGTGIRQTEDTTYRS